MSQLSKTVDSLEDKLNDLIKRYTNLQQENQKLIIQNKSLQESKAQSKTEIADWKQKIESLKMANAMLGSDQYKRDTKLKINALVRELDHCIGQLSE